MLFRLTGKTCPTYSFALQKVHTLCFPGNLNTNGSKTPTALIIVIQIVSTTTDYQLIKTYFHAVPCRNANVMTLRNTFTICITNRKCSCSCGSVVEHCVRSAKGCGFNSQRTLGYKNVSPK